MSPQQRKQLTDTLLKYKNISSDKPGLCNKYIHHLNIREDETFRGQSYPIPLAHQNAVVQEIHHMININVIEMSHSSFVNSIIPVTKKSGETRLCLDAHRANE